MELRPDFVQAYNNLGLALTSQGKLDDAEAALWRALTLNEAYAEAHHNLANVLSAKGRPDKAIACYRRALELRPQDAHAYNNLGRAFAARAQFGAAITSFREALRLNPEFAEAHYNLGHTLQERGNLADAVSSFREAVRFQPDYVKAHNELGVVLQMIGKPDESAACFRDALRLSPDSPEAHYKQGLALERLGDLTAAEAPLREALRLDPEHVDARAELAVLLRDRLPKTDETFVQRLLNKPGLQSAQRARLHFALVQVHDARGEYSDAARHAREGNSVQQAARAECGTAYDAAAYNRFVDLLVATFTPEFFAARTRARFRTSGLRLRFTALGQHWCNKSSRAIPRSTAAGSSPLARMLFFPWPQATSPRRRHLQS